MLEGIPGRGCIADVGAGCVEFDCDARWTASSVPDFLPEALNCCHEKLQLFCGVGGYTDNYRLVRVALLEDVLEPNEIFGQRMRRIPI